MMRLGRCGITRVSMRRATFRGSSAVAGVRLVLLEVAHCMDDDVVGWELMKPPYSLLRSLMAGREPR